MLLKDEMKLEQKLNQSGTTKGGRAKATKKADSGKRKKLIALRDLRHQLDEVSARRVILSKAFLLAADDKITDATILRQLS